MTNHLDVVAGGAATGGRYALLEVAAAHGVIHPAHVHRHEDEALIVLSGSLAVAIGREEHRLVAGHLVRLPRGVPHRVAVSSGSARFLILYVPAGLEDLLAAWARDDDDLAALLAVRGVEWVPDPR